MQTKSGSNVNTSLSTTFQQFSQISVLSYTIAIAIATAIVVAFAIAITVVITIVIVITISIATGNTVTIVIVTTTVITIAMHYHHHHSLFQALSRGVATIFPEVRKIFQIHPNTRVLSQRSHIPWLHLLLLSVW